jgi:hypothetical protein|mmetsp:Transcript_67180/g.178709  ORF Transcript_67180/g.178709 Transcript_67180/m.178709 type:complete len:107 (+) Transcript_67180:81-401(+)
MAKRPFPSTFATALRGAPRTLSSKIAYPHEALATADRVAHNMQCQSDIERVTAGQNTAGRANALTRTTNLPLDPPETLVWGIPRTEHAHWNLIGSEQACNLATRAD